VPTSPPTRCTGCNGLIPRGERCHNPECVYRYSTYKRSQAKTNDPRWVKIAAKRLQIDPYCTWLTDDDHTCTNKAEEVDHLDGADKSDDSGQGRSWLNLDMTRSLCADHHRLRTAQQSAMSRRQYS
jgi:hypothetical protein